MINSIDDVRKFYPLLGLAQCLPDFVGLQGFVVSAFCFGAFCALIVMKKDDMNITIESIINFFIEFDVLIFSYC